ncbi:hypothetical protein NQZ68_032088, partial [Dissostichus eleginoides]
MATKTESEKADKTVSITSTSAQDTLIEEWMYYRNLQHGEREFTLRKNRLGFVALWLCFFPSNLCEFLASFPGEAERADECILALDKLTEINSGIPNSMDLCRIAAVGHSFGERQPSKLSAKMCGVALDAWMFPLDDELFPGEAAHLLINSEKFQWAGNISRMKKLDSAVIQRKMITIRYNQQKLR